MSHQTKLTLAGVLFLVATAFCLRGCGHYPEVNKITYEHAKALFSVCNRQDTQRLQACANMITDAEANEEISSAEATYLNEIIESARNERWKEALAMSRQLMMDQLEY